MTLGDVVLLVGVMWLLCATGIYGLTFAYFQAEYSTVTDYRDDMGFAIFLGLLGGILGPVGVGIVYLLCGMGKHGLKFA